MYYEDKKSITLQIPCINLSSSRFSKHLPNLLNALVLRQQQSQQNTRLLRVQEPTGNLGLLGIVARDTSRGNLTVNGTVALNNGDVLILDNVVDSSVKVARDASGAGSCDLLKLASTFQPNRKVNLGKTYYNTLSTLLNSSIKQITVHILIRIEDIHTRNLINPIHINLRLSPRLHRRIEEIRLVGDQNAQVTHLHRLERVHRISLRLGHEEGRVDPVVQDDHRAAVLRVLVRGDCHGLQEVHGSVCGECGGGTHGAYEDDGFAAVDGGVDEEGGFLEGVCAVGDDCAGHGGVVAEDGVQGVGEVEEER